MAFPLLMVGVEIDERRPARRPAVKARFGAVFSGPIYPPPVGAAWRALAGDASY